MLKLKLAAGKFITCRGEWKLTLETVNGKIAFLVSEGAGFRVAQHARRARDITTFEVRAHEQARVQEGSMLVFSNAAVLLARITPTAASLVFMADASVKFDRSENADGKAGAAEGRQCVTQY